MPERPEKKKTDIIFEYDHLDLGNACSATECTGLIQVPPMTEDEEESYLSIADYRAPSVAEPAEEFHEETEIEENSNEALKQMY